MPALPLFGGTVSSAQQGERNNPEPARWLERGSEVLGPGNPGDRQRPPPSQGLSEVGLAPALAAPGLPLASCPALKAGPSLGEGRRRK